MRLLILLPFAPRLDAVSGGARVNSQFLTEITSRHKVAVLYFREANEPGADPFFRARCVFIEEVVRPASKKSPGARLVRYARMMLSLVVRKPLWVADWFSSEFESRARVLVERFQPDIIQAEIHVMGQYFSALQDVQARRVLVEYESSSRAAMYLQSFPQILKRFIEPIEKVSWQRYERWLYSHVDAVVAFTEADQQSISETAGQTPIHIIPPGTFIPERPLDMLGSSPPNLLFVGNFYHPPNVNAARRLTESIFPAVEALIPNVKLFLVGENPPSDLNRTRNKNIVITGRVPDVTPYLNHAALIVAPLHFGGGIRIKILEGLAAGKAIVTTPLAAEGLDIQDGEQLAIAKTDAEFIARIVQLLRNSEERRALAKRARAWACENIAWEHAIVKYEALYSSLLS